MLIFNLFSMSTLANECIEKMMDEHSLIKKRIISSPIRNASGPYGVEDIRYLSFESGDKLIWKNSQSTELFESIYHNPEREFAAYELGVVLGINLPATFRYEYKISAHKSFEGVGSAIPGKHFPTVKISSDKTLSFNDLPYTYNPRELTMIGGQGFDSADLLLIMIFDYLIANQKRYLRDIYTSSESISPILYGHADSFSALPPKAVKWKKLKSLNWNSYLQAEQVQKLARKVQEDFPEDKLAPHLSRTELFLAKRRYRKVQKFLAKINED